MNRTLARTAVALAAALALGGSTLIGAPALTAAASPAGTACLDPGGSASARGVGHGGDTRGISASEQRDIAARTAKILAAKGAGRGKPGGGGGGTPSGGGPMNNIPVYVHVMTSTKGAGDVTDAQIAQQVVVLNDTYSGHDVDGASPVDTGAHFYLAGTDRIANDSWHTDKQSTTYRSQTRKGGKNALNIWLVDFAWLGIATFPWDYAANPAIDGIRVQYSSLPGGSIPNYSQGETATHEAGHWLGLYHTFQGGCQGLGDEVADTAAQASASSGCPVGRDSCTAPGTDPIHNYMDYSFDSCYTEFTPGQSSRIAQMWAAYRA